MNITIRHRITKLLFLVLAMLFACQSSTPIPPTAQPLPRTTAPTDTPPPLASPTSPGPRSIPPVPPEQTESAATTTNSAGIATFDDPLSEVQLKVEFLDETTQAPVPEIQVWFVSNGPKVLVMTHDPTGVYAPLVREFAYEELVGLPFYGKLASPVRVIPLAVVVVLFKAFDLYLDAREVVEYFAQFPEMKDWRTGEVTVCMNSEQAVEGGGIVAKNLLSAMLPSLGDPISEGLMLVFEEVAIGENIDELVEELKAETPPAILQVTLFSFNGGVPKLLQFQGYCLEPLNRSDPQSALNWLLYGLEQKDLYPFQYLANESSVMYANYIEGGQSNTSNEFLADLNARLSGGAECQGYDLEYGYIQVWTTEWTPPWEMTELCYVDCNPIFWQSTNAGFFLTEFEGEWWLNVGYLNTPENYFFTDNFQLVSCNTPYSSAVTLYPTPNFDSSCPGAPPQQMVVDQRGYVCTQSDRIVVRSGPGRSNDEVTRLDPGTPFTVTGGPSCANDWSWWEIRTDDGLIGWISEGGDNVDPYFVCPMP